MSKILKIIIIIVALVIIILAANLSGYWTFLNWPLNKISAGTPDASCFVDEDCKIAATTCAPCDCGQAVNINWNANCPFKSRQVINCKMCASVQAICRNYACRTEPINLGKPAMPLVTNADLLLRLQNGTELAETEPVDKPLPAGINAGQIQKYFKLGNLYLALVLQPSMNVLLSDVPVNYTASWVGVLAARVTDDTWTQLLQLTDQNQTDKNNPYYLWIEDNKIYLSVVDQNGAGSGEGHLKLLALNDQAQWQLAGCYYFDGNYTDGDYFIMSQRLELWEEIPMSECQNLTQPNEPSLNTNAVAETMTYLGTKYINCRLSNDFPAAADQITELSGIVIQPPVSRNSKLINAVVIDNNVLYNPITRDAFASYSNFKAAIDKEITVKGYYGDSIEGYDIFNVTDVPGWQYICCDATLEDTGKISTPNVCHWFAKK